MIVSFNNKYLDELKLLLNNFNTDSNNVFVKRYCYLIDNHVVGFIDYSIYYDRAELNYIVVDELYRRKGIASSLIKYMIDDAKKNKCINITLEVNEHNLSAINLYKKYNFIQVAVRKNYYKDAQALLLELKLEGE